MATTVVQQPQQQPTTAPTAAKGPTAPGAPNDQAAAAAKTERRKRSALLVPPSWQAALSTLLPADPGAPLGNPPVADVRRAAFRLDVRDVRGFFEALTYLQDAEAPDPYLAAMRELDKNAQADKGALGDLRSTIATLTAGGDLNTASLSILATLAKTTEDGKTYLTSDDAPSADPITRPLRAYIDDSKHWGDPNDAGVKAQKSSWEALVTAIHHPHNAAAGVPPPITPAPLTPAQQKASDALVADIQQRYPLVDAAKADPKAAIKPEELAALLAKINAAEAPVREHVYAWRDPKTGKGVLQLFGSHLSPSQVEEVNAALDPVERLYKECGDIRNGRSQTKQPGAEYQTIHDFLAAHLGDEPTRHRVRDHAPLMQQFVQWWPDAQRKILLRMIVTGHEQPDAVDRVHDAADAGDSNAAITAIYDLGSTPERLQDLRKDLIFVHRLQDRCGKRVVWNGIQTTAFELFLRMCGVDPSQTREAGSVDKQTEVDPSAQAPKPLTPEERGALDAELYVPFIQPIVDQLNSWWTRDSKVMAALRDFQSRCAKADNVDKLRRAHEAPGPELAKRIQAAGCDVRLKLQRGLDADNLVEAERILAFVADQASVGVIGGQGTLVTDNRPASGQGKVPLEQALRETTLKSGTVLTQVIHDKAHELADEFGRWFGARAGHIRSIWQGYRAEVTDEVCADLREKTGMPRVWPIELLANAFVQVGGGTLQSKLQSELGKDPVIAEMGMQPGDVDARRTLAEQKVVQDNQDESKNTAAMATAQSQVQQAAQLDQFKAPAKELFDGLAGVNRYIKDEELTALGGKLSADLKLGPIAAAPKNVTAGPVAAPIAEHDVSARPGGPAHPDAAAPTDFGSYYRQQYGIEPRRHAVEVAKGLANSERTAQAVGKLLGVDDPSLYAPPKAPSEALAITAENMTLVGPDFTVDEAKKRAQKMWDLLHDNGQVQLIRQQIDGRTAEEQRLIHIAFRQLSGGIDLAFYMQQHLSQQQAETAAAVGGDTSSMPLSVGGGTGDADKRGVRVIGDQGETEMMLEVSTKGRVSLEKRIAGSIASNNMDDVYAAIEGASADERRAILANDPLMNQLRKFGDDSYEWNRIYKGLSGESDMFDRLESRAHGRHGFLGGFEGTDEKGMSSDIKSYAKQRAKAIRAQVTKEICGDAQPTPQQKKMIDDRVAQQLSAEFQANSENPEIRAILHDELSGVELSDREGLMMNAGDDSKVASALTEGDWTEDEEKIIDDIKHMSPDERRRCRNDPEYINQLHKAIQSQTTWRDAMIALDSDADGSKEEDDDNFAKLERASRSSRQDTTELMFEQDDVIQALSRLSPDEYARLQADPRLQAQILTSLEGYPDKLKMARQMMAFNAADAGAATGLQIGDKPDPAKGVYSRKQVERLAFLKFGAENRIRAGSDRSWAMLVQAAEAIYNMKLRPSDGDAEAAPDAPAAHVPSAVAATAGSGGGDTTTTMLVSNSGAPQPDGAPQPQAAPKPAEAPPIDPKDGEAAIEDRLRHDILGDTQSIINAATEGFGNEKGSDDKHERTSITPKRQQEIITKAILHEADPSDNLLMASTAWYGDDEDRIKDTIHKASDEQLIKEWTTVIQKSPNGSDSLGDKYTTWKTARAAAATDAKATDGKRNPKVGSPEWKSRTAFKCHLIDTSEVFEDLLLKYTGGLFADDDKMKKGEERVRDNKEWLEWRTLVRDRIPGLDKAKIGGAIHASDDTEAMEIINDPTLRNTLNALSYDEERYAVDRGENSNYNMDRVTAGGQGLALDNAMGDYRREVLTSVISKGPDAGNQYGVITAEEGGRIADAKARFNTSDSEFREAKAAVANIAATVVALVITAVVTILTAGTATGPVAVILLGAATAAASSAGTQLTKEAIQGTDFDLGKEGLENIARDTVMGAVTAGSTYYAGKIAGSLWNTTSAAEQAALVGNIAKSQSFFQQMGKSATEMALMTGMEGVFESGMAAFDPALWMDGWSEGWRRGGAAARERAQEIPMEALRAALLAAFSHAVTAGGGKLFGVSEGGEAEGELQHAAFNNRQTLAERVATVTKAMKGGMTDGLITGAGELLFDERTWRGEGVKPVEIVGVLSKNVIDMMNMAATNIHMSDAGAVQRMRSGGRELALHGHELTPELQQEYAALITHGHDGSIITIAEFKKLHEAAVSREAPSASTPPESSVSEPKVTTVDPTTSKATQVEISKVEGDERAKLGDLTPVEQKQLEDMLRAHGTEHGRELFEAWRAKQPATDVSATPDPVKTADAAFARGDLDAAHEALQKLDPDTRAKVEQSLLTKYGADVGAKDSSHPTGDDAGDTRVAANSPRVTERVQAAMDRMDPTARAQLDATMSRAQNDGQRVLMERAVASGHSPDEVHQLFLAMHGLSEAEALSEFSGAGVVQFYQASCVPTSYQIALAEVDPVFALKLRNNPEMVLGQQRDALEAAGGARHQRADVRKGQDIPDAMQDHLDDPRARQALDNPDNYGPGTGGGIEATKMVDQPLHKQLEATTGVKYDVITNDSLSYDTPGQGEFGHHQVPHDRIIAALDAHLPVLIGMMGHANVIVAHEMGPDGKEMYTLSDPMSGKTSKVPADLLDVVLVQSLTIPHAEPKPVVTPEIGAKKPIVEDKSVPAPRGDEMADETRTGGAPDPVADPKLVELTTKAREKYGPVLDDAIVTLDSMVGDLGHVEGRAKDPVSAANRLQRAIDKFGAKVTDVDSAIANLWDAIGTRIVVDHPTPDVMAKVVARLVDAINAGKLKVTMANNLHGEGGLPYMTPEQMQQIAEAAGRANGKEIQVDESKKMPGGFTSATIYVEYPGGVKGEIQIIGKGAMAVAEVEHIPYDVGLEKPLVRNIDPKLEPELRAVVAPIETAIREVNADPARKAAYDKYLCDMYRHVRALEMGQESTPPTVPPGIDPALSYESLVKVQDAVAAIKAKSKGGSSTPEVAKPETADALDVKKTDGGTLTGGGEGEHKPSAIRTPVTPTEAEDAQQLEKSTNRLATTFGDRLEGADTKLVGPPTDRPVIQQSASDALIGLPTDVIPPGMNADQAIKKLQTDGMPRWGALTANERAHETAFAATVEQNLPAMVEQFFGMSRDKAGTFIFEVDGAKKLYGAYGADKAPKGEDELHVRATANHALHPTAVAIARIAFLRALDEMAALPATDPRKAVFVTNGGCAAGKGSLTEIVKGQGGGKFNFGAVWDAAGEGDSQENGWILAAAQSRGIKVTYGFVESDPMVTYNGVLDRAQSTGRIVDPITFTRSYTRGQENMREFLASPEYQAAQAKGEVDAVGVYTGKFDMATKTFPEKHMLGDDGRIGAKDIKDAPDEAAVTAKAIEIFQQWLARQEAEGKPTDDWFEGGAVNTLKFGHSAEAPSSTASATQTGGSTKLTAEELQKLLRRADGDELKDKALRPDISGPLATEKGKELGASLPPAPEGQFRTVDGSLASTGEVSLSPEARQWLAEREAKRGELTGSPRKVVVDGGGPTGALTAIQAYNLGHDVTIVEMRDEATLPILWTNRPGSMDILQLIDPVLAARVKAQSGDIHFYEHVEPDGTRTSAHPDANRPSNPEGATGDPRSIAGETSSWQSQNRTEVNLMWDRLEELAKIEGDKAKAEGREPRLKLLRGYEVKALPEGEGDKRGIVVQKVEERLQKVGPDGRPAKGEDGKPLATEPYTPGSKVPDGYKKIRGTDGKDVDLGTPDDIFVAEGAGSKTRGLAGSKSVDVGPSAQYIAGYFEGAPLESSPDAEGKRQMGGSRSIVDSARDGSAIHAVAGTSSAVDASGGHGTWALPEVDPTLDLNDPKSIEKYFGRPMTTKDATLTYYKQQIGKVLEVPPETIPDNGFVFGPAAFTLQSHVSTPVASDAQNVHLIGDARGNSHFLASLGKVTGTGTHQMAVRQYFEALQWGLDPEIASAILERRLDAGTRVWLKSGLPSFTDRTPAANGAADGTSVLGAAADSLAAAKDQPKLPADTVVKAVAGPSGSTPAGEGPITVEHFPQAQLVIEHNNPQVDANGYRAFMADSANQALADLQAGRPMAEVMAGIEARRVARGQEDAAREKAKLDPTLDAATRAQKEALIDAKVAKMQTPIVEGDPNYDPFGQLSGRPAGTPGTQTRADIGGVMADRFNGTDGDTVVNKVTVDIDGQPTVLPGNTLHRGASAETIDDTKGNKYGYDPAKDQGKLVISETADPKNQQIFKDAGMTKLDRMTTVTDFADAAYLLFMGPVVNRGSDSNIRTLLTAAYTRKFGAPVALPQDIDVQAYARDQDGFKSWLVDQLNVDGPKGGATETVQRRTNGAQTKTESPTETAASGTRDAGSSLPFEATIQESFGRHDVSQIRSHQGASAQDASAALGARAFAVGDAVAFADTPTLHTAAHEAAHVVQQRGGVQLKDGIDTPGDVFERHADAVADRVATGQSAESLLDEVPGSAAGTAAVQRSPDPKAKDDPAHPKGMEVELPGRMFVVTIMDGERRYIASATEPIHGSASRDMLFGEISPGGIRWDDNRTASLRLEQRLDDKGRLSAGVSLEVWIQKHGHGRARYVLVEVEDASASRAIASKSHGEETGNANSGGASSKTAHPGERAEASSATGTGSSTGTSSVGTDATSVGPDASGHDDRSQSGNTSDANKHGSGTSSKKGPGNQPGNTSNDEHGGTNGKSGGRRDSIGVLHDPDLKVSDGTKDFKEEGEDAEGMPGGAGKKGDHGAAGTGDWFSAISVAKSVSAGVSMGVILLSADISGVADDMIQSAFKLGAKAAGKGGALAQVISGRFARYVDAEMARVMETAQTDAGFLAKSEAQRADVVRDLRAEVTANAHDKVAFELDAKAKQFEKSAKVEADRPPETKNRYSDSVVDSDSDLASAAKNAKDSLPDKPSTNNKTTGKNAESPAIEGSPYHPDAVQDRVKPKYKKNPAHDPKDAKFNPRKTEEPIDAEAVYATAQRGAIGTWYGKGEEGWYQFFSDNANTVHFAGIVDESRVPIAIRRPPKTSE